jgi:type IV pilus assembly protein PilF
MSHPSFFAVAVKLPQVPQAVARGIWWLALLVSLVWLQIALTGCAAAGQGVTSPQAEPLTEFDEPDTRKRARIRLTLASNYFDQGQTSVALDEIKQSLAADPSYLPAYVLRGLVYMRLNNNPLAEDSFQRALQINPRDGDTLHNYGWFVCESGRHAQAIVLFDRALANPNYGGRVTTHLAKGICQTRAGQLTEAEASFTKSYELDAANPITGYNLASLLFRRGEYTRAQFYIRRLNNSELSNAETLWLGIRVERKLSDATAVEQLAQQLGRRYVQSPQWALYQRGAFDE